MRHSSRAFITAPALAFGVVTPVAQAAPAAQTPRELPDEDNAIFDHWKGGLGDVRVFAGALTDEETSRYAVRNP